MPYVRIEITDGATYAQKLQLYKETTEMLVRILNKKPEYTFVVIEEVDNKNWGHMGTSVAKIREGEAAAKKATAKPPAAKAPAKKAAAAAPAKKAPAVKAAATKPAVTKKAPAAKKPAAAKKAPAAKKPAAK